MLAASTSPVWPVKVRTSDETKKCSGNDDQCDVKNLPKQECLVVLVCYEVWNSNVASLAIQRRQIPRTLFQISRAMRERR